MKCAPWRIVTANSFPVDSGSKRVRGDEHAKALVEFAIACVSRKTSKCLNGSRVVRKMSIGESFTKAV